MKRILFLPVFLFAFASESVAQRRAEEALDKLYKDFPQEKIVLTLSKGDYLAGETILFKVYALIGYEPSDISTNAYVELFDQNRRIVDSVIVPLYKGSGEGSFVLPPGTGEGVYYIRAYTRWMFNFTPALPYIKAVKIYNPYSSKKLMPKPARIVASVFPESGDIVAGAPAKIAIRLSGSETHPAHWHAKLFEKGNGRQLANASSLNPQLAVMQFNPQAGSSYFVEISDDNGNKQEVVLPEVKTEGTVLQVNNEGGQIRYSLYFINQSKGQGYKIIGTLHDQTVIHALVKKPGSRIDGLFDTKDIPNGVLRLTVFDEKENPVAERLCFIRPMDVAVHQPAITFDTLNFAGKSSNSWTLHQDTIQWFSWSVQVQDAEYPKPGQFLADLYLTSDFTSVIDNPSWYFENTNTRKAEALDALLITEKWQRFDWKNLVNGRLPKISIFPEKYLSYKATVVRKNKVERLKEVNLVFQQQGFMQVIQAPIDSFGNFYLQQLAFNDTMKIIYQLNSKKHSAKDIDIIFEPLHKFFPLKNSLPEVAYILSTRKANDKLPTHIARALETVNALRLLNEKSKMMEEVVIRYNRKTPVQKLDDKLSSGMFKTGNEILIDFINEDQVSAFGYSNILQWLNGRVPGLRVSADEFGTLTPSMRGGEVPIFVDELRVTPDFLSGFSAADIAMIKVIRGIFLGTSFGSEGAIAIYTKRGGLRSMFDAPLLPSDKIVGYRKYQPLSMPDYSIEPFKSVADEREILFRRDLLTPDANGESRIFFYNNDSARQFRLIVTGFTADGRPVYLDKVVGAAEN